MPIITFLQQMSGGNPGCLICFEIRGKRAVLMTGKKGEKEGKKSCEKWIRRLAPGKLSSVEEMENNDRE